MMRTMRRRTLTWTIIVSVYNFLDCKSCTFFFFANSEIFLFQDETSTLVSEIWSLELLNCSLEFLGFAHWNFWDLVTGISAELLIGFAIDWNCLLCWDNLFLLFTGFPRKEQSVFSPAYLEQLVILVS